MACLLLLVLFLSATVVKQPYTNHYLNVLETFSLISSAVTVYSGVYFIADLEFKDGDCNPTPTIILYSLHD